jgi:hypothetical protein
MADGDFTARTESFGYSVGKPWADDAFAVLFAVPRLYRPLLLAWDARYPGTRRAVDRLTRAGFLAYQPAVVVDVRTRQNATRSGKPVARFRANAKGRRLAAAAREDIRSLHDVFPKMGAGAAPKVLALLAAFVLEAPHSRYGMSSAHAGLLSGLPERSGRWWVRHLVDAGYLVELAEQYADVREVVPEHWRVTRALCTQLASVIDAFPEQARSSSKVEFRLNRTRFLADVDPARVGLTGATDYDHDIECQGVLAALLRSPRCEAGGVFAVEPRITLAVDTGVFPWTFPGPSTVFYQPDAELRERTPEGSLRRSVVEYERFQSRRDAWSHIERFLGWLHTTSLSTEPAALRFVVDTEARLRSYVDLIEAFADYLIDHPERVPANEVVLAVSSVRRVLDSPDPLDDRTWFRISLPAAARSDTVRRPVLHVKDSPYEDYFTRG